MIFKKIFSEDSFFFFLIPLIIFFILGLMGITKRVGPHGDRSNSSVSVDGGAQGFTA